jgi:hypothetical protein
MKKYFTTKLMYINFLHYHLIRKNEVFRMNLIDRK